MIILFKLYGTERLVKYVKVLHVSIKSIKPMQKYAYIIESYACILKIFVTALDLSINILISFGTCSTTNYQNK